mgnify:CR=1 FL=1
MSIHNPDGVQASMSKEQLAAVDRIWAIVTKFCKQRGITDFSDLVGEPLEDLHRSPEWQAATAPKKAPDSRT